ncbi:hypothetical protein ACIP9H_33640 [Streptomyces sp. NPDC088732]|uniref:hypothetical protein n=1 Tax=Streptomyces sp. NPDC088732 TaxID=3365879 RepID=UPI0037F78720
MATSFQLDERERTKPLAAYLAGLERRIQDLERANPLTNAALDGGSIEVYDDDGSLQLVIGDQPDGTTGVVHVNGPPPPVPTTPMLTSVLGGVAAMWDGGFTDSDVAPLDFSRIEVHASASPGFEPTAVTQVGSIESPRTGTCVVPTEGPVYVRFLARNLSGTASDPSEQAGPLGPAKVVADDVLDGIITDVKLADEAVTAGKIALGAVSSTAIADGAILEEKLHEGAVTVGKLADGAVTDLKIAEDAVTEGKIALGAVSSVAIADGAILEDKLSDLAVSLDKLQDNSVGAGKIAADAVTAREIKAGAVTASEIAAGAITTDKLTVVGGSSGNVLSDPSFEGNYTAALVATNQAFSVDSTKGNGSAKSLKVNAAAGTPTTRTLALCTVPVAAGDVLNIAIDYQASADYTTPGAIVKFYARWEDSSGVAIGFGSAQTTTPVLGSTWQRLSVISTAPANTVKATICVESFQAQSGTLWFDNASVRPVFGGTQIADGAITTAKMVAGTINGDRITANTLSADKIVSKSITALQIFGGAITATELAANAVTAAAIAAGAITTDKLVVSGGANMLSDPSFEGTYSAALVAAANSSFITIDSTGNGSGKSLKFDMTSGSATTRNLQLSAFPLAAGDQLYLAVDYLASSGFGPAGGFPQIYARFENSTGGIIAFGSVVASSPVLGAWTRISGTVTAPANTVRAYIYVEVKTASAGTVNFDNAACRPVLPGTQIADGAITTQKMIANSINGDRITANSLSADKIVALSITGAQIKALEITGDKIAANAIKAGHLDAGSVTAVALSATAIDGKTITGVIVIGGTVRTADTGNRVEMTSDTTSGRSIGRVSFYTEVSTDTPGSITAQGPADGGRRGLMGIAPGYSGGNPAPWWKLSYEAEGIPPKTRFDVNADTTYVNALNASSVRAGNIASGRVTITVTAANTPTSGQVSGLNLTGGPFRVVATPATSTAGTTLLGWGVTNQTATGFTVWVTRSNATQTLVNVDWVVIAE